MSMLVSLARKVLSPPPLQRGALRSGQAWLPSLIQAQPYNQHVPVDALCSAQSDTAAQCDAFLAVQQAVAQAPAKHARFLLHAVQASPECLPAIAGFTKSLSKEVGMKGGTANAVIGNLQHAAGVASWLASTESAFTSGQVIQVREPVAVWPDQEPGTAVVTGGARGIGKAIVQELAAHGYRVLVVDQDMDAASQLAEQVRGTAVPGDLTQPAARADVVQAVRGAKPQLLVHNAGITRDKVLKRGLPADIQAVLSVNVGAIRALDAELGLLDGGKELGLAPGASVQYMASINGLAGAPGQTGYAYTKGWLVGHVRTHAEQAAQRGVRMNAVAPGFIQTAMTDVLPPVPALLGQFLAAVQHIGQPADVAAAVLALAHPSSAGVWGNVLRVCGGNLAGA